MKCNIVLLTVLALLSVGSSAPEDFSEEHKSACGPDLRKPTSEEEVLLYSQMANATYEEIKSIGGRVTLKLGRNLIVAKVPSGVELNLKTASLSIPRTAPRHTLSIYERAYRVAAEELRKPSEDGRRWDELSAPKVFPKIQTLEHGPPSPYADTMAGKIVIILIMPSGPDKLMSDDKTEKALNQVVTGVKWWADQAPSSASLSFVVYYARVTISASGDSDCCDTSYSACHNIFGNAALQALGYSTGSSGRNALVQEYVDYENADGGVIGFITNNYKLCHFAYAYFGGGPVYMDYDNDGWGSSDIDKVFAHELGHTFNAPDEYTGCNCNTNYGEGTCTAKNDNCKSSGTSCTSNQANCIMDNNSWNLCNYTPKHVGWC